MNDAELVASLWGALLFIGLLLPFVNTTFSTGIPVYDANAGTHGLTDVTPNAVNAWSVIASLILVNLWTFGGVPWYIDLTFLMVIRVTLAFVIARNIWIGGGG